MKILERLALIIFSIIILVLAVTSCLVVFDLVELENISKYLTEVLENETVGKVVVISSVVCILLAIKALIFPSKIKRKEEFKSGILLENKDGRLLISKDTIENLINSVVKSFKDAMDVQTKVLLDSENNITVFISLLVNEEAVIKQLSSNIQNKIKETVKRNTDLEVSQVNINVKNIENKGVSNKNDNTVVTAQNSVAKIKLENVQVNKKEEINQNNSQINNFNNNQMQNLPENTNENKNVTENSILN